MTYKDEIRFSCLHCQQHLQAEANYAGLQITCPACGGSLEVSGPAAAAPSMAPRSDPAAVVTMASASAPADLPDSHCLSCGTVLARGAILCTQCGYNRATGQRIGAGRPVPPGKPSATPWDVPWYSTPYPYLGVFLAVLGCLFILGRQEPAYMLAFFIVAGLYSLGTHILVFVAAFQESIGTGFLTLCIPFYALYFVFKVSDSGLLRLLYTVAFFVNIALRLLADLA